MVESTAATNAVKLDKVTAELVNQSSLLATQDSPPERLATILVGSPSKPSVLLNGEEVPRTGSVSKSQNSVLAKTPVRFVVQLVPEPAIDARRDADDGSISTPSEVAFNFLGDHLSADDINFSKTFHLLQFT